MSKSEPMERKIAWVCQTCPEGPEMSKSEFVVHLKAVHKYERAQARRQLVSALDGSDWYANTFEWTIPTPTGDVKALQCDAGPRHKHDPMRYED